MVAGALQELGTAQGPGGHHPHGAPVLGPWWGHRLGDLILSVHISVLMPVLHCFDYCSFVISFEIKKGKPSNFVILIWNCLGYLGS